MFESINLFPYVVCLAGVVVFAISRSLIEVKGGETIVQKFATNSSISKEY